MAESRAERIEAEILQKGFVRTEDLCQKFDISKNTLRKELNKLVLRGTVSKVYGGAKKREPLEGPNMLPLSFRNTHNLDNKKYIANLAAEMVQDGDTIYLDVGSTILYLVPLLKTKKQLTVITHSLPVMNEVSCFDNTNLIALGGAFSTCTQSFIGPSTLKCLDDFNVVKLFTSATGISLSNGVMYSTVFEAELKQKILSRCKEIILLSDSSKYEQMALVSSFPLDKINCFVTNAPPPPAYAEFFSSHHIALYY